MLKQKCYIVRVGLSWNYSDYDWEVHVFLNSPEAEAFFGMKKEELIEQTIADNNMNEEEAKEYREEVKENSSDNFYDNDGEWAIDLDVAILHN